jgi:hypothetical protein
VLLYNPYNCCSDTLGFNDLFECARKKTKQNVKLKLKLKNKKKVMIHSYLHHEIIICAPFYQKMVKYIPT